MLLQLSRTLHIFAESVPRDLWTGAIDLHHLTDAQAAQLVNTHRQTVRRLWNDLRALLSTERGDRLRISLFEEQEVEDQTAMEEEDQAARVTVEEEEN